MVLELAPCRMTPSWGPLSSISCVLLLASDHVVDCEASDHLDNLVAMLKYPMSALHPIQSSSMKMLVGLDVDSWVHLVAPFGACK